MDQYHGTTILSVRRGKCAAMGADGQVTLGNAVMKSGALKVPRNTQGQMQTGFAPLTAESYAPPDRSEETHDPPHGNLLRPPV